MRRSVGRVVLGLVLVILPSLAARALAASEERVLRMITVLDPQQAQDIHQQLRQGTSFSALARARSIGPERSTWGYTGIVRLTDMQPELRAAVQKLKEGQISDILEVHKRFVIIKVLPPKMQHHFDAADRARDAKQLPQAVRELQAALRLEDDNVQTHIKLGLLLEGTQQLDEAIQHLEKAQQYAPQEAQIALLRGAAYTHAATAHKNPALVQKALEAYQQVLQLDERLAPAAHFGLGKVHFTVLQQPKTALEHLEKAVQHSPREAQVHQMLIQAYYDTKQYDKAWQHLRRAQGLGLNFPELQTALQKVKPQK